MGGLEDVGKLAMAREVQKIAHDPTVPYDPREDRGFTGRDPALWIKGHISLALPEDPRDYISLFELMMEKAAANPNLDHTTIKTLWRDMVDVDDRAHSEGRTEIALAMARKTLAAEMLYMARGDNRHEGLSATSSMITLRHSGEQTVKIPQQSDNSGIFGFWRRK